MVMAALVALSVSITPATVAQARDKDATNVTSGIASAAAGGPARSGASETKKNEPSATPTTTNKPGERVSPAAKPAPTTKSASTTKPAPAKPAAAAKPTPNESEIEPVHMLTACIKGLLYVEVAGVYRPTDFKCDSGANRGVPGDGEDHGTPGDKGKDGSSNSNGPVTQPVAPWLFPLIVASAAVIGVALALKEAAPALAPVVDGLRPTDLTFYWPPGFGG